MKYFFLVTQSIHWVKSNSPPITEIANDSFSDTHFVQISNSSRGGITFCQSQTKNFPSTRQGTSSFFLHSPNLWVFIFPREEVVGEEEGKRGVLSYYMYLSARVFTCSCHPTWQVYQCPRLIGTRPSAWQAEPTAPRSRLTAPQVGGGVRKGEMGEGGHRVGRVK